MDRVDYQTLVIQDILNLNKSEELDLSPWYQRRSVWNPSQKSYLINTLLEQKPIPAIYVRHSIDLENSRSIKEIVDGQQRTRTILEYCANRFASKHPNHKKKVKFSELTKSERERFLLTSLPIGFLLGATDSDVIDIFGRINSISKSLNAQERRNAAFSGEFKQFCLEQASTRITFWRIYRIYSANDIARMTEIQFVSDLVINLMYGLSDFSAKSIDEAYKAYDDEFVEGHALVKRLDFIFDQIVAIKPDIFANTIFRRPPILFSLLQVLDEYERLDKSFLANIIDEIDRRFQSEENVSKADIKFRDACSATTQRIAQRRIRHDYIVSFID